MRLVRHFTKMNLCSLCGCKRIELFSDDRSKAKKNDAAEQKSGKMTQRLLFALE